ncbi:UNVERIFIED_CONTAM: hypothetical protein Sangu_1436400 [Sesamum angustifolium]|uniref:Uncharacterized protein n=1 Tax=Sesamum angustifolium TaxID=2727405 RepID=A0AAW2N833_9LAMI
MVSGRGDRPKSRSFTRQDSDLLPDHDITLEAAWPQLFIGHKGKYWEVLESISVDCSSLISESGLRYRFGIHKNSGLPHSIDYVNAETPLALLPGVCAKAAFSYQKSKDLWRQKETKEDVIIETEKANCGVPHMTSVSGSLTLQYLEL